MSGQLRIYHSFIKNFHWSFTYGQKNEVSRQLCQHFLNKWPQIFPQSGKKTKEMRFAFKNLLFLNLCYSKRRRHIQQPSRKNFAGTPETICSKSKYKSKNIMFSQAIFPPNFPLDLWKALFVNLRVFLPQNTEFFARESNEIEKAFFLKERQLMPSLIRKIRWKQFWKPRKHFWLKIPKTFCWKSEGFFEINFHSSTKLDSEIFPMDKLKTVLSKIPEVFE